MEENRLFLGRQMCVLRSLEDGDILFALVSGDKFCFRSHAFSYCGGGGGGDSVVDSDSFAFFAICSSFHS